LKTCEDDKERKMKELQSRTELVMLGTAGVVKIGNAGGSSAAIRQRFISHTPRKGLQEASKSGAADGAEIATLRAEKALNHKSNLVFGALLILLPVLYHIIILYQNYIKIISVFHGHSKYAQYTELRRSCKGASRVVPKGVSTFAGGKSMVDLYREELDKNIKYAF